MTCDLRGTATGHKSPLMPSRCGALPTAGPPRGNGMAMAGFALSIIGWVSIWLFPFASICWVMGAAFSFAGKRRAARRGLPQLWLARAGFTISALSIITFTTILLVANHA